MGTRGPGITVQGREGDMNGSRAVRCHRCGTTIENLGSAGIMWGRPGVEPVLLRRPVILCKQECLQAIPGNLPWVELTRFLFKTEPEEWGKWLKAARTTLGEERSP